jgi:SAM-dependent methyltransferase
MSAIARLGIVCGAAAAQSACSESQAQTRECFGFKWSKRETYESPAMQEHSRRWLFEKYCAGDPAMLDRWLADGPSPKIILDAGCGCGYSAKLLFAQRLQEHDYLGVDISNAVDVGRERFAEAGLPGDFLQADLQNLPIPDESVDMVFSEGVLHHTDDTGAAIAALARKLKPGGRMLFYVYRKKAVIREFTDDHVRAAIAGLSDEEAWEALKPLTRLGVALGDIKAEITVAEDIPQLGIKSGTYPLQRFFYWNICKLFHREEFSFDEMHHINFDWFRPQNCHRHTPEEVRGFCAAAGLTVERLHAEDAGISVVAVKD